MSNDKEFEVHLEKRAVLVILNSLGLSIKSLDGLVKKLRKNGEDEDHKMKLEYLEYLEHLERRFQATIDNDEVVYNE